MRQQRTLLFSIALLGLVGIVLADEETDPLQGIRCPVSDEQVTNESLVYRGATLYFCCADCVKAFEKDPKKYAAQANFQLVATDQATQKACIFCQKEELIPETELDVAGVKIRFGCFGCMQQIKDAEDQIEAAFNDEQFENGFQVATVRRMAP